MSFSRCKVLSCKHKWQANTLKNKGTLKRVFFIHFTFTRHISSDGQKLFPFVWMFMWRSYCEALEWNPGAFPHCCRDTHWGYPPLEDMRKQLFCYLIYLLIFFRIYICPLQIKRVQNCKTIIININSIFLIKNDILQLLDIYRWYEVWDIIILDWIQLKINKTNKNIWCTPVHKISHKCLFFFWRRIFLFWLLFANFITLVISRVHYYTDDLKAHIHGLKTTLGL